MLTLTVKPSAGTSIQSTAFDMQWLSDQLSIAVEATFNDITLIANPGGHVDWLVYNYYYLTEHPEILPRTAFSGTKLLQPNET